MLPPWQPMHPHFSHRDVESHETSSCSESETSLPVLMANAPSMPPMVEKAQHEPQSPWSLMGVTLPAATQSTDLFVAAGSSSYE